MIEQCCLSFKMQKSEIMSYTHSAFQTKDLSIVKEERFVFRVDWFDK